LTIRGQPVSEGWIVASAIRPVRSDASNVVFTFGGVPLYRAVRKPYSFERGPVAVDVVASISVSLYLPSRMTNFHEKISNSSPAFGPCRGGDLLRPFDAGQDHRVDAFGDVSA
jgi:hypothetical protein